MINKLKQYKNSIMAGMSISLGAFAYLITLQKTNNPFIASMMFYTGLSLVLIFGFDLFTGQVLGLKTNTYTQQYFSSSRISTKEYIKTLSKTWIGNLIGSVITTILLFQVLHPNVEQMINTKLSLNPIQLLVGGIACNFLVCCAVANYKMYQNHLISGFFITVFVICGFLHCIADMTYFTLAICSGMNLDIVKVIMYMVLVTLGNVCGGLLLYLVKKQ